MRYSNAVSCWDPFKVLRQHILFFVCLLSTPTVVSLEDSAYQYRVTGYEAEVNCLFPYFRC